MRSIPNTSKKGNSVVLTSQLIEQIDNVLNNLNKENILFNLLDEISEIYKRIVFAKWVATLDGDSKVQGEIKTMLNDLTAKLKSISMQKLMKDKEKLQTVISDYHEYSKRPKPVVHPDLGSEMEIFYSYYETALKNQGYPTAMPVLIAGRELFIQLLELREHLSLIKGKLQVHKEISLLSENIDISLVFTYAEEVFDPEDLGAKIYSLGSLYNAYVELLKLEDATPLQILKLETGSDCWLWLQGRTKILQIIPDLLNAAMEAGRLRWTRKGQMETANMEIELIKKAAYSSEEIQKLNISEEEKEKYNNLIIDRVMRLIPDPGQNILVNGKALEVKKEQLPSLPPQKKKLELPPHKPN